LKLLITIKKVVTTGVTLESALPMRGQAGALIEEYKLLIANTEDEMIYPHPLAGNTYIMKNRYSGENKWVSYKTDGLNVTAAYTKQSDAAPFKFYAVEDQVNTYTLQNVYSGLDKNNHWLSFRANEF
jgi:hypothetical protein